MDDIKWIKRDETSYDAKIGCINLCCRPVFTRFDNPIRRAVGWRCVIYFDHEFDYEPIGETKRRRSLRLSQEDGEKLVIEYLRGYGFLVLKQLKRMGLLEEMLSEVGVEL